jgi:hypothetical protein
MRWASSARRDASLELQRGFRTQCVGISLELVSQPEGDVPRLPKSISMSIADCDKPPSVEENLPEESNRYRIVIWQIARGSAPQCLDEVVELPGRHTL